jgi:hypothetical protein
MVSQSALLEECNAYTSLRKKEAPMVWGLFIAMRHLQTYILAFSIPFSGATPGICHSSHI